MRKVNEVEHQNRSIGHGSWPFEPDLMVESSCLEGVRKNMLGI